MKIAKLFKFTGLFLLVLYFAFNVYLIYGNNENVRQIEIANERQRAQDSNFYKYPLLKNDAICQKRSDCFVTPLPGCRNEPERWGCLNKDYSEDKQLAYIVTGCFRPPLATFLSLPAMTFEYAQEYIHTWHLKNAGCQCIQNLCSE